LDKRAVIASISHDLAVLLASTNPQLALDYLQRALNIFEDINNQPGIAAVSHKFALFYMNMRNPMAALPYLERTKEIYEHYGAPARAAVYFHMAQVYGTLGHAPQALEYARNAKALYASAGRYDLVAQVQTIFPMI